MLDEVRRRLADVMLPSASTDVAGRCGRMVDAELRDDLVATPSSIDAMARRVG
jgi:hypothetical protein